MGYVCTIFATVSLYKPQHIMVVSCHCCDAGGVPAMTVQIFVDDELVVEQRANVSRAGLPPKTGAPNTEHGFAYALKGTPAAVLSGAWHTVVFG